MKFQRFLSWTAVFFLLPFSLVAIAGQCDAVNKGDGNATVHAGGKTEQLRPGGWISLNDCTSLTVVDGGPIQIRGVVGGVPRKASCERNTRCSLPPTSKSLVVSQLSSYTYVPGARRMDKGVTQTSGIPRGELYSPDAAGSFDFTGLPGTPSRFALYEAATKHQIYQADVHNSEVSIPLALFKRGTKYTWMAYGPARGDPIASGGFELISDESASAITHQLEEIEQDNTRGRAEATLDKLDVYYSNGLSYEFNLLRATALGEHQ